jgi:predicted MFS family arabinose efflux permease
MFFFSVSMVYYNHLMLDFASEEKTSLDLATYTTLTNIFKPVGVFVSGLLADSIGLSGAYYFAALLAFLSALTCFALPKAKAESDSVSFLAPGPAVPK